MYFKIALFLHIWSWVLSLAEGVDQSTLKSFKYLSDVLQMSPLSVFSTENRVNPQCFRDIKAFQRSLSRMEMWALQMVDSTAKVQSGLLNGNIHFWGDFDQCLAINRPEESNEQDRNIVGKYCRAEMFLDYPNDLNEVMFEVFSHQDIVGNFETKDQYLPNFNEISMGFCIPSSCNHEDLTKILEETLKPMNSSTLAVKVRVRHYGCDVKRSIRFFHTTRSAIIVILLLSIITMTAIATTKEMRNKKSEADSLQDDGRSNIRINHNSMNHNEKKLFLNNNEQFSDKKEKLANQKINQQEEEKNLHNSTLSKIIQPFTLQHNWRDLFTTGPRDRLSFIHGIRFIFSILVLLSHSNIYGLLQPMSNKTTLLQAVEQPSSMIFRSLMNLVDPFVVMSGFLTTYHAIKRLQSGETLNIPRMYLLRYLKFAPLHVILVAIFIEFGDEIVSGPMVLKVPRFYIENCKKNFWKNVFFVDNFSGMNGMCYPPAHQLFTDMQMYILAPFIILIMWKLRKSHPLMLITTAILTLAISNIKLVYDHKLSSVIYHGISLEKINFGADMYYLNPIRRLIPYLMGMALAFHFRTAPERKLTKFQLLLGWSIWTIFSYYSIFGQFGAYKRDYVFNFTQSTLYTGLQPLTWNLACCWIFYVCFYSENSTLNKLLGWKGFEIYSRLCYTIYIAQIAWIFLVMGVTVTTPIYVHPFMIFNITDKLVLLALSVTFTLLIVIPPMKLVQNFLGPVQSDSKLADKVR